MYNKGTETKSHRDLQNHLGVSFPRGKPPEGSGWYVKDTTPPEPTLDDLRQRKRNEINSAYRDTLTAITDAYPDLERESWGKQEAEARAALSGSTGTPYLDTLAAERGIDRLDMAQVIVAKADAWAQLSASATGKRHRLLGGVDVATTEQDLDAIIWE